MNVSSEEIVSCSRYDLLIPGRVTSYPGVWVFTVFLYLPRRAPGKCNHTSKLRFNMFSKTGHKMQDPKSTSLKHGTYRFMFLELKFQAHFQPTFPIWKIKRYLWNYLTICLCIPLIFFRRLMRSLCCLCVCPSPLIFSFSMPSVWCQTKVGY
jgi:hypothetical protein